MNITDVSQFNKSFSGTDTVAFIILPGCTPVCLGSVTTVSYSVFRNKKPVINLGRTNINGVTRGSRIYAGTIIFTLINQHWVRELISQDSCKDWLGTVDELKADELPLFDIMLVSANEYGAYCSMFIYGIDLTDEAQTISIEDLFTENVFQFVARDLSTFKAGNALDLNYTDSRGSGKNKSVSNKISSSRMYIMNSSGATTADIDRYVKDRITKENQNKEQASRYRLSLARTLYESTSNTMMGNDVISVQTLLNQNGYNVKVNGIFDHDTSVAIRQYEVANGFMPTGVVDTRLYNSLVQNANKASGINNKSLNGYVVNKNGAREYRYPNTESDIIDIYSYKSTVQINDVMYNDDGVEFYITENGYVLASGIFNSNKAYKEVNIPTLDSQSSGYEVSIVKQLLNIIYPDANIDENSNVLGPEAEFYIRKLQKENNRPVTGKVDSDTWILIQHLSDNLNNINEQDDSSFKFSVMPSKIALNKKDINSFLTDNLKISVTPNKPINVKTVVTSYKNNKSFKTRDAVKYIERNKILDFSNFKDNFIYDAKTGSTPDKVEMVLYPYNMEPYKWIITLNG
jgi:peptidoglycan hydrolase-like protein with peptidoglycan-binding domain